jgi:DNA-binding XRE family transcriptional regulator
MELGEAMAVSRQTINSIEKERYTPSLPLAIALARYFLARRDRAGQGREPVHTARRDRRARVRPR